MLVKVFALFVCVLIRKTTAEDTCGQRADVVFMLDTSASIWEPDYKKQLAFVSDLVTKLNVGPNTTHVGVVSFSTGARVVMYLNELNHDIQGMQRRISNTYFLRGSQTQIDKALKLARESLFSESRGARPDVPRLIIIITDGYSTDKKKHHQTGAARTGPGNQGPEKLDCKTAAAPADIMYVTDFTHADNTEITNNLALITKVTEGLGVSEDGVRVGLTANNCVNVADIRLEVAESAEEFAKAVALLGSSATPLTYILKRAKEQLTVVKKGAREGVKRIAVVFVHGPIHDLKSASSQVRKAKSADNNPGVEFIFVGMGDKVDEKQLQRLSGEKDPSNVRMLVDKPGQLEVNWENVLNEICEVLLPSEE
ncbi:collagen alpha-1(XII) chain-like [Pomacea canaliculata]|nr:collagen alpha-1(XII) chain-like [Pomacea canaliculata]